MLLLAAAEAALDLHVIIDNLAVQAAFARILKGAVYVPKYCFGMWLRIQDLVQHRSHSTSWVPSHGKSEEWAPPDGQSAEVWRHLNQCADDECNAAKEHCLRRSVRSHVRRRGQLIFWSSKSLELLFSSTAQYRERILAQLGLPTTGVG
jgi:hypothetical protein